MKNELNMENVQYLWLCNVGVEKYWISQGYLQFPKLSNLEEQNLLNHYDAMNIWSAGCDDILILRKKLDREYKNYIQKLGKQLPDILVPDQNSNSNNDLSITQLVLQDETLLNRIRQLNNQGKINYLMAYGISDIEQKLAEKCMLPLWGCTPDIVKKVNSKAYSCQLNHRLNFATPGTILCKNFYELNSAFKKLFYSKNKNEHIALKEVLGASGSGLFIIKREKDFSGILKLLRKQFTENSEFEIVIEKWLPKKFDFNLQITVLPNGVVRFNGIKQLLTKKNGTHLGHFFPPGYKTLSSEDEEMLKSCALEVGRELYKEGYYGLAGIDALKTVDNIIIPVVEINARFNMASYLDGIRELVGGGKKMFAKSYDFLLDRPLNFNEFMEESGNSDIIFSKDKDSGILIYNFSTVNANFRNSEYSEKPLKARVFVVIIEDYPEKMNKLDMIFQENVKLLSDRVKARYKGCVKC